MKLCILMSILSTYSVSSGEELTTKWKLHRSWWCDNKSRFVHVCVYMFMCMEGGGSVCV